VNEPVFRVVLTDKRNSSKSGKFKEVLGSYDPKAGKVEFKAERVKYWLGKGAQASVSIHNFLVDKKLVDAKKRDALPKRKKAKKE
jgi:small subunit ribosomal protein S16